MMTHPPAGPSTPPPPPGPKLRGGPASPQPPEPGPGQPPQPTPRFAPLASLQANPALASAGWSAAPPPTPTG